MPKRDPRVDAYIAKSADFAKPILRHFRDIVDEACPDAAETIRWGSPAWQYAGGLLCSMAAFKQHCAYGFWKAPLLVFRSQPVGFGKEAQFGHLTSLSDLPARSALVTLVKQAAKLNADGAGIGHVRWRAASGAQRATHSRRPRRGLWLLTRGRGRPSNPSRRIMRKPG